ncbi:hypothetical protein B0T18DRAFT_423582 [Schizothecium vesticola]|uniref:Uncharacterized protein n=1 Tax=Schizothecium vesticola TaxID=314040 RepID=A0AA40KBR0_9PEZI|nr:hypothetical protein B0T18DRAFT_423582 [Schizothecium vesticola]
MSEMLSHKYSTVDQRLERVEALLQNQAMQMHAAQARQAGRLFNTSAPPARQRLVRTISPSSNGQTPLTTAIQYNNHPVLRLLLERWFEYAERPRLTGPNLLEKVAQYADGETMLLLTATEHLRARKDSSYVLDHYHKVLKEWIDFSDKLGAAFEDLLSVLRMEAEHHRGMASRMESGLLNPLDRYVYCEDENTDSSELAFEDAEEILSLALSEEASEPG